MKTGLLGNGLQPMFDIVRFSNIFILYFSPVRKRAKKT